MDKRMGLFLVFFIVLLLKNSYIYKFIFQEYIYIIIPTPWIGITNIMAILLYLIAVIPLTAYLSNQLVKYWLKGFDKTY